MLCASFSPGGMFLATGCADHHVRVYAMFGQEGPERILEKEVHSDRVDSIQWANQGLRFISGSKDGTALLWRYENAEWRTIKLRMTTRLLPAELGGRDSAAAAASASAAEPSASVAAVVDAAAPSTDNNDDQEARNNNNNSNSVANNNSQKLRVTMVTWSRDDRWLITAVSDFSIKVWDSNNGILT